MVLDDRGWELPRPGGSGLTQEGKAVTLDQLAIDLSNVYHKGNWEDVANRVQELVDSGEIVPSVKVPHKTLVDQGQPDYFAEAAALARIQAESHGGNL